MSAVQPRDDLHSVRSQHSQIENNTAGLSLIRRSSQPNRTSADAQRSQLKQQENENNQLRQNTLLPDHQSRRNDQLLREDLSRITSAPRSKKVYIFTGGEEFSSTVYPQTTINQLSIPKDQQSNQVLTKSVNRGILKRKAASDSGVNDDTPANNMTSDIPNSGERNTKRKDPILAATIPINLYPSGTGNSSIVANHKSPQSSSVIQPSSKIFVDVPLSDSQHQPISKPTPTQTRLPSQDVAVDLHQPNKSFDKSSTQVQPSILLPLKEDSKEITEDFSSNKQYIFSQPHYDLETDYLPYPQQQQQSALKQSKIQKRRNNTTDSYIRDGVQLTYPEQTPQRSQRSLFYLQDESAIPNNGNNNLQMTGASSSDGENKFVHTQSYLKRRIDNLERQKQNGQMPLLNEVIGLPRQTNMASHGPTPTPRPLQDKNSSYNKQRYQQQQQNQNIFNIRHKTLPDEERIYLTDPESSNKVSMNALKYIKQQRRTASQTLSPFRSNDESNYVSIDPVDAEMRQPPAIINIRQNHSINPTSRYPSRKGFHVPLNPLLREYQMHMNVPLVNERVITDPQVYTHQAYQRSNMQRQQNQKRMINLLEEQDKIMGKMIEKYKIRANKEEVGLKQKLLQIEKERDQLLRLKNHEQTLGVIKANLSTKLESFKSNAQFYNEQLSPKMPGLPAQRYPMYQGDMHDLVFLESMMASQQNDPVQNRYYNSMNNYLLRQRRARSQMQ